MSYVPPHLRNRAAAPAGAPPADRFGGGSDRGGSDRPDSARGGRDPRVGNRGSESRFPDDRGRFDDRGGRNDHGRSDSRPADTGAGRWGQAPAEAVGRFGQAADGASSVQSNASAVDALASRFGKPPAPPADGGGGRFGQAPTDSASRFGGPPGSGRDARGGQDRFDGRGGRDGRSGPDSRGGQDGRFLSNDDSYSSRRGPPPDGGGGRKAKGAPTRFGSVGKHMDGALRDGEDVPGGTRIDVDGMVYEMDHDGSVRYFQDRGRKYPFSAGANALPLLRGLLATNERVFAINKAIVDATGDAAATIRDGEQLYADKPTMKQHHGALGTWSDEEYAHPGLQSVYLRLKSFQRFTESWALYERAARRGVLERYLTPTSTADGAGSAGEGGEGGGGLPRLRVASLGGGPGYELLAFEWFIEFWAAVGSATHAEKSRWLQSRMGLGIDTGPPEKASDTTGDAAATAVAAVDISAGDGAAQPAPAPAPKMPVKSSSWADEDDDDDDLPPPPTYTPIARASPFTATVPPMDLVSLDLQPTWAPYVSALRTGHSRAQYTFHQWDIKKAVDAVTASGLERIDLCVISNVLVYCTDENTADVLTALLTDGKVHAILINERGGEQKMVDMLEKRGVSVTRLMDNQTGGRDDRQLLLLPPGADSPAAHPAEEVVFPNVPYEENKNQ